MGQWLEGLLGRFSRYRVFRFGERLVRGCLEHDVGKSAAALAYYLLFSFFPFLIFLSTLVGFLELEPLSLGSLHSLLPREVIQIINAYLLHVTELKSGNLLAASLVISLWLPMRAVDSLMRAVNVAYGAKNPRPTLRHQVVVLLFTLFLMAVVLGTLLLLLVGRGLLTFLARYFPVITPFIGLWNALRFPLMGVAFFLALGALYWVAPGAKGPRRRVFPGAAAALCSWLGFSLGFSFYVENIANYSVLYGALGGMVVLLLWLYATGMVLILGAEVNGALGEPG
ncbi:MAG: YihY/virulence factor BrkB family protein [Angelakisella sp.]|jgi:membrane protein|nr:YihY/virulence factor BrkB family protein [Angelakisella sp.]